MRPYFYTNRLLSTIGGNREMDNYKGCHKTSVRYNT